VDDYRPVTLLSCVGKVLEKIIAARIRHWVEQNNLIAVSQSGFRQGKSATDQIVHLVQYIHGNWDKNHDTAVFTFDIRKAFDTVWHDGLLWKLKTQFNIGGLLLRFIDQYLQDRRTRVKVNGAYSLQRIWRQGYHKGVC